jgi:hypothetical protein
LKNQRISSERLDGLHAVITVTLQWTADYDMSVKATAALLAKNAVPNDVNVKSNMRQW